MVKQRKDPVRRKQCGSVAGYRQHSRRGERSCQACREANREYMVEYRSSRAGSPPRKTKADKRAEDELRGERVLVKSERSGGSGGYPDFLRKGGRELWDSVKGSYELPFTGEVLLLEACRLKDRLDKFTAALSSNSTLWFELKEPEELEDGTVQMQVVVNSMIAEARQTQAALGVTLGKIGVLKAAEAKREGLSLADELKRKRQERLAAAKEGA